MSKCAEFLPLMILMTAVVFLSGCATGNVSYTNQAPVLFERIPAEGVFITDVGAYEDGGKTVVYGKVKRASNNCCDAVRGHVDIAVVAPDGVVIDVINVSYSPRNIPKTRSRKSRFMTSLPYTLAEDMTLQMTYHGSPEIIASIAYSEDKFPCQQNIAAHKEEG